MVGVLRSILLTAHWLLLLVLPAAAQEAYIFGSANTRTGLSAARAEQAVHSAAQEKAVAIADRAACALAPRVTIADTLGIFSDGPENSFLIRLPADRRHADYLAAVLGRYLRQKYMLTFVTDVYGRDELWIVTLPRPVTVARLLREVTRNRLAGATVLMDKRTLIQITRDDVERQAVARLVRALHGRIHKQAGTAHLFGAEDREQAAHVYDAEIAADRNDTPSVPNLATSGWRDATGRTCSQGRF